MRLLTWILFALAAISAAPIFVPAYLPFTDLPEHAAVMSAIAHWNDPAYAITSQYTLVFGKSQYLLYHVVGAAVTFVVGDADLANRILLGVIAVAWPFSFRAMLRAFGRAEYLAIFAPMVFWNRALQVGFLPYLASIPILLWGIALVVEHAGRAKNLRQTVLLATVSVVLFYVHVSAYVLFVASATLLTVRAELVRGSNMLALTQRCGRSLGWIVPSVIAAGYWWTAGKITLQGESLSQGGAIGSMGLTRAFHAFPLWTHDVFRSHVDEWCAAVFWASFIVLVLGPSASSADPTVDPAAPRMVRVATRISPALIPLACVAALYFLTPFRVGAGVMLNVRLAPILSLFVVAALRAPSLEYRWAKPALFAVCLATVVMAANAAREMLAMNREEMGDVRALFEKTKPGKRLIIVNLEFDSPHTHFPPWVHAGAYYRVDHGGIAAFSFSELLHWPLHYRAEARPPAKPFPFWEFDPCSFRNRTDGAYYDYLLLRGRADIFQDDPPGPKWKLLGQDKSFRLYEKTSAMNDDWPFADEGPCVSRDEIEKRRAKEDAQQEAPAAD